MIKINLRKFHCQCGCNEELQYKEYWTWYGIPKYQKGHENKGKKPWNTGLTKEISVSLKKLSESKKGCKQSVESNRKRATALKGRQPWNKGLTKTNNTILKHMAESKKGKSNKGYIWTKEQREHVAKLRKGRKVWNQNLTEKDKEKYAGTLKMLSKTKLELWQNVEFAKKMIKSWHIKPNKPELHLQSLLNDLYPNEFKYVGDGDVIIAGKCPDFINVNGKKQIIELYGDYWHKGQKEEDRVKIFEPYGYKTLIIWEKELKDVNKVKEKIQNFLIV